MQTIKTWWDNVPVERKKIFKSWRNVFVSALIASLMTVFMTSGGTIPLDGATYSSVLVSGLVAVLPVIKNYFDKGYDEYGR